MFHLRPTDASMGVDVQATFMKDGGLAILGGEEILVPGRHLVTLAFRHRIFTRDMHRPGHICLASSYVQSTTLGPGEIEESVAPGTLITLEDLSWIRPAEHAEFTMEQLRAYLEKVGAQMLWSDHGEPGTLESEVHPEIDTSGAIVFQKGLDPVCDSYSAVFDNLKRPTGLVGYLETMRDTEQIKRIFVWGLAFDYCVGWTVEGLIELGFEVVVVMDATRSISSDGEADMREKLESIGVEFCNSDEIQAAA